MHTSSLVVDVSNTNSCESGFYHVRLPFSFRPLSPPTHLQLDTTFCITSIAVSSNRSYLACRRHSSSPYSSRRVIRALFQWLSRPASRMGRRSRTTPRNRLVRSHTSQLDRYALLYEPPAFFLDTSIPQFLSSTNPPHPPPAKVPPQVLSTVKISDNVAYPHFPKKLRSQRNHVVNAG